METQGKNIGRKIVKSIFIALLPILGRAQTADSTATVAVNNDEKSVEKDTMLRRDVEVTKEYTPVIKEAGKVNTMPELKDEGTKKIDVKYDVWTSMFKPKSDVIPTLDYATATQEKEYYTRERYLTLGGGNRYSFLGELYTPIYKSDVTLLDLYLRHNSCFGNIEFKPSNYPTLSREVESKGLYNDNKGKISFLRSMKKRELSTYGDFGYTQFNYYGAGKRMAKFSDENDGKEYKDDDMKQAHLKAGFNFRFRNKEYEKNWKYDLQTNYKLLNTKSDVMENSILTELRGSYNVSSGYVNLVFEMDNVFVKNPDSISLCKFDKEKDNLNNYTVIKLNPYYTFSSDIGELNLGIKAAFSIKQGRKGSITPDIFGNVKIIRDVWYLYAGVTGDYKVNTLRKLSEENLWTMPNCRPADTYIPIDVYVGTKFNIAKALNADVNVGYKIINNPYFFVNKSYKDGSVDNIFDVVYDTNAGLFLCGASINYQFRDKFDLFAKFEFNKWIMDKQEEAWMRPSVMLDAGMSYTVIDALRFSLNYTLEGGRKALIGKESVSMKNVNDLSIGVNYGLFSFLDIFAKFNNILNQKYEMYYGYPVHGFNFLAGLTLTF